MRDDEILVNQWLADDLQVKPGDSVALSYYVVDSGSRLVERTNSFRVRQIVPLKGIYADRTLMPEFPGLAKAESTHDWDAGFPLVYPIRAKDEAYWKTYRGTPKAFVTLAAGQAMWANRFGSLTAIRYEVPTNTFASTCREAVYRNLLANLQPEDVGLHFEAVREQALKSAAQGAGLRPALPRVQPVPRRGRVAADGVALSARPGTAGRRGRDTAGTRPDAEAGAAPVAGRRHRAGLGGRCGWRRWAALLTPRRCCGRSPRSGAAPSGARSFNSM